MFNTTPEPILFITAVLLTIMATYTSIDLLTLVKKSEHNNRFLFLGGIASMSMGLWIMNFLMMASINRETFIFYEIPSAILSLVIGFIFTFTAFLTFTNRRANKIYLFVGSLFLTTAVICIHLFGIFSIHASIEYNVVVTVVSLIVVYITFFIMIWLLFYSHYSNRNVGWIPPVSSVIITFGVGQAYYFLTDSSRITINPVVTANSQPFLILIALIISILILGSLIVTHILVNKRLEISDTYIKDILKALDTASIVAITDPRGNITYANDKFVEISKYPKEEIIGQNHRILNSGHHSREFFKELWRTIGTGHVWKGEIKNRAKDGSYYWVDTTIVPFLNNKGKPYQYLSIRNDITERKKTEELMHRSEKLAVVGQLAAGVAHEIRNPLTSMRGYAEFLTLDEKDPERKEYLDIILDEIERVDSIVEDFMVLAKPTADKIETQNIIPVMKDVLTLMDYEARKNKVSIQFHCEHDNITAVIDENRMKQVFLNLVKNAIEAMPNGGVLKVKMSEKDNEVHILIQDTGEGIPPEKLKKIGEPFYTTKATGTGLGLMTTFSIIESHRGKIFVDSELNKGTEFHIILLKPEKH